MNYDQRIAALYVAGMAASEHDPRLSRLLDLVYLGDPEEMAEAASKIATAYRFGEIPARAHFAAVAIEVFRSAPDRSDVGRWRFACACRWEERALDKSVK